MKMRTLVTGGAGFIGSNLVRKLLESDEEVHLILSEKTNVWRIKEVLGNTTNHYIDLTEKESVESLIKDLKPEIIYHLATHGAYPYQTDEEKIIQTNLISFMNLLNACSKQGFKKFLNTGSSSEYGFKTKIMKENNLLEAPYSCYAFAKSSATLYSQYIAKKENLPINTLRIFSAYGDYEEPKRLIPTVINNCLKNQDLKLANKKTARDFIYVQDVVDAYIKASQTQLPLGEILNVCSGKQYTLEEVVNEVIKLTNSKSKILWGFYESRPWDSNNWQGSNTQIKKTLKWQPKNSLQKGLEKTINWIKNNSLN